MLKKFKSRSVDGEHLQDGDVISYSCTLPTVSTSDDFITIVIAAKQNRAVATVVVVHSAA